MHSSRTVRHCFVVGSRAVGVDACSLVDVVRHRALPARILASAAAQSAVAELKFGEGEARKNIRSGFIKRDEKKT